MRVVPFFQSLGIDVLIVGWRSSPVMSLASQSKSTQLRFELKSLLTVLSERGSGITHYTPTMMWKIRKCGKLVLNSEFIKTFPAARDTLEVLFP